MLKQRNSEHWKNPGTKSQETASPVNLPYSKQQVLMIKLCDSGVNACTFTQCIYWFVICRLNHSVALQKDSCSALVFKSSVFPLIQLLRSS